MTGRSSDARALLVSVWVSAGFAVVSLAWGLLAGSLTIVFDGLYSFAAVGLSLAAVLALRTARAGADERYPWGREVWEPLTVLVKAAALGALCLYALVGAVGELLAGGREVSAGWAVVYAVLATAAGVAVTVYLQRRGGSDLVRAEAAEWRGDTWLSAGVLAGFVVALVLQRTGRADLARYVDPAMVALVSAAFLWVPARLVRSALRELLTMSPEPAVLEPLRACVREVEAAYGFAESFLRASKVGGRVDVEIDYVVADGSAARDVWAFDTVRQDIADRLAMLPYRTSVAVGFTADRRWVA
ncbi:MAG: cation diffusion facilitator family transporter [Pseudonocardia sp.]|nr:cation diffusion facilitator family transporter [Pseudonocardia sp.]